MRSLVYSWGNIIVSRSDLSIVLRFISVMMEVCVCLFTTLGKIKTFSLLLPFRKEMWRYFKGEQGSKAGLAVKQMHQKYWQLVLGVRGQFSPPTSIHLRRMKCESASESGCLKQIAQASPLPRKFARVRARGVGCYGKREPSF